MYSQQYDQPTDTAGPIVADVLNSSDNSNTPDSSSQLVRQNTIIPTAPTKFIVQFGEDLDHETKVSAADWFNSVCDPSNWTLTQNGNVISGGVASVTYQSAQTTNGDEPYFEVAVTFNVNG